MVSCPGSSPLTRGKHGRLVASHGLSGLIPAHAGKTGRGRGPRGGGRAHPRSRGENRGRRREPVKERGSSPLTRGKPRPVACCCPQRRLIPAHAGKTSSDSSSARSAKAHPRSRGENASFMRPAVIAGGSSPLTRGKHRAGARVREHPGLIPAHAGKTTSPGTTPPPPQAHPRSRGENDEAVGRGPGVLGSSPLTRGKRYCG